MLRLNALLRFCPKHRSSACVKLHRNLKTLSQLESSKGKTNAFFSSPRPGATGKGPASDLSAPLVASECKRSRPDSSCADAVSSIGVRNEARQLSSQTCNSNQAFDGDTHVAQERRSPYSVSSNQNAFRSPG
jgi:hypothetical protein